MKFFKQRAIHILFKQKIQSFLLNENNPHPLLYFSFFFYTHSPLEHQPENYTPIIYLFALGAALICNFNFLFALAPYKHTHIGISTLMFLISMFSCNEKWKAYIFILSVGDTIFSEPESNQYFITSFSLFIACQTYRSFVFRSARQNVHYFVGMSGIATCYIAIILSQYFQFQIHHDIMLILLVSAAFLAFAVMQHRIEKLKSTSPLEINSDNHMAHYLMLMEEDTADSFWIRTRIFLHSKRCQSVHCFCHKAQLRGKTEYFMRQLYENAVGRFRDSGHSLLYECYVSFLLKNAQIINALHFLSAWQPNSLAAMAAHLRCKAKVEALLGDENSANNYEKEYFVPLEYDRCSQQVALQINAILKAKLHFWHEVNRENPRVSRIQIFGLDIVSRMHSLNLFYSATIKRFESAIFLFDSTALYAMYLLSTTNFKEYAQLIIKNTAKLLEDVYLFQNSASETFSICTVVKKQSKCYINKPYDNLGPINDISTTKILLNLHQDSRYKLIIDQVSSGLCKILGIRRRELIGRQLNTIIPDGYKEVHKVRLSNLLDFESESLKEIVPSKVMHKELKLPIKGANGKLLKGFVCIKSLVNLDEGLTFVSIIKLAHDKSSSVLLNYKGEITQIEEGFNLELLSHSEIVRYLERLKETWRKSRLISQERFNIIVNTANYGVTISSPLLGLFLEKDNLQQKCPPIHIQIVNDEVVRNRTAENDRNNKIGMQIKHMELAISHYDTESSTNNSKGGNSAVNTLNTFSQANTVPLYRFLQLIFLATIACCVLSNAGAFFVTKLPWDSTQAKANPLNDTMNLYSIHMLTVKALILLGDEQNFFFGHPSLNRTRISEYFGFSDQVIGYRNQEGASHSMRN